MTGLVFVGVSLDGFIARPDGALDWMDAAAAGPEGGPPPEHGYEAFFASCDALLMGRATFETVLGFGIPWPYGKKPVRVASSTLTPDGLPEGVETVRLVSGDPVDIAKELDAEGFDRVYVDGARVVQAFLRAGLIHELTLTVLPILIGEGIPLFGPLDGDVRLRHVETRTYPSGLVQSRYRVLG